MPSLLPHQGVIPRSPLGGVELPQTIKLIAGGSLVGTISFKPARYFRTLLDESYLTALQVKTRMIQKLHLLLQKILKMTTNTCHNIVRQVMLVIV